MTTGYACWHNNYGFCGSFSHVYEHLFYDVTVDNGVSSLYVLCFYLALT